MLKIIRCNKNTFDIFGPEWANWSRVKVKEGKVFHLKGSRLEPKVFYEVRKKVFEIMQKEEGHHESF